MAKKHKFIDPIEEMEKLPIISVKTACVMVTQIERKQKNGLVSTSLEAEVTGDMTPKMAGHVVNVALDRAEVGIDIHFQKH